MNEIPFPGDDERETSIDMKPTGSTTYYVVLSDNLGSTKLVRDESFNINESNNEFSMSGTSGNAP